jgi:hypothetical protein
MRKSTIPGMGFAVLVLATLACSIVIPYGSGAGTIRGSGNFATETRSVNGIKGVELAMSGTLHIAQGESERLVIEAEENLLPHIETVMRGSTLLIRTESGTNIHTTQGIDFRLTVTELTDLSVSSSGDILAAALEGNRCVIDISSSGSIDLDSVDCTILTVRISSSGEVAIAGGSAERQDVRISSSGDYYARDVAGTEADIDISSSGSATVNVAEQISGSISSSGNIYYAGNPGIDVRTSSTGRVEGLDN